jgi:hypothetical protein
MTTFAAIFRLVFEADSEVEADVEMESLSLQMERYMEIDPEDSSTGQLRLTQLVPFEAKIQRGELVNSLRLLRNQLIAQKHTPAFEAAKQLDYLAWSYAQMLEPSTDVIPQYDQTHFLEVAQAVFQGKNPTD